MTIPPLKKVACSELQELCRKINCLELSAKLTPILIYDQLASFESQQVFGTSSQLHHYYDEKKVKILSLHRFLRPDETLGGVGTRIRRAFYTMASGIIANPVQWTLLPRLPTHGEGVWILSTLVEMTYR